MLYELLLTLFVSQYLVVRYLFVIQDVLLDLLVFIHNEAHFHSWK